MAQYFYDGQIRRYLTQTIRVFSHFMVKYNDGSLMTVPVMYGDPEKQAASIIRQNSENVLNSAPKIAVYITNMELDRSRLSDSTFVSKTHIREREFENDFYNTNQGRNYTVERLMPTPFILTMKVDIWSTSVEQKLQIWEQILVLFNPSLEIQSNDNYLDWSSLSVLDLKSTNWSSRSVPVGSSTAIDIATITVEAPIWINPPAKVKHLGIITSIISSIYNDSSQSQTGYIEGLGYDTASPTITFSNILSTDITTITDYNIQVYNNQAILLGSAESVIYEDGVLNIPVKQGPSINWREVFNKYPNKYVAGSSRLYIRQQNGSEIIGTISLDQEDETVLNVNWDNDTLVSNTDIESEFRPNSPGTFDAIIDPTKYNPKRPNNEIIDQPISVGTRFLIIEDIGNSINDDGADAWKSLSNVDLVAKANDIIEWSGVEWRIIFNSQESSDVMIWLTNIFNGVQYKWNGIAWDKSFEGIYRRGHWRIEL